MSQPNDANSEPLAAWLSPPRSDGERSVQRFECTSRGDRVSGVLWLPARGASARLALAVHALAASVRDPALEAAADACARRGSAFAAIDLPLHGERHNAKLSRRAIAAASGGAAAADAALWRGLVAQAAADLSRALDALARVAGLGNARVASVAFADALPLALAHAAADARVGRVLAVGASPRAEAPAMPIEWLARPADLPDALARL